MERSILGRLHLSPLLVVFGARVGECWKVSTNSSQESELLTFFAPSKALLEVGAGHEL